MNTLNGDITRLRLTNKHREIGGDWFYSDSNLAYARSVLEDCQRSEPNQDWHLLTRGEFSDWHRWEQGGGK